MGRKRLFMLASFLSVFAMLTGCTGITNNSSADWALSFVVWEDYIYQIEDEYVVDVGREIGKVTTYSDTEGTYSGNFSNEYEKGTKFYSIAGISTDEAIAIEEADGKYRKAIRGGKYGEK